EPRKTQEALAFLARACRENPRNEIAATRLFSLLSRRDWILPLTERISASGFIEYAIFNPYDGGASFITSSRTENSLEALVLQMGYDGPRLVELWDAKSGSRLFGPKACTAACDVGWISPKDPWLL